MGCAVRAAFMLKIHVGVGGKSQEVIRWVGLHSRCWNAQTCSLPEKVDDFFVIPSLLSSIH